MTPRARDERCDYDYDLRRGRVARMHQRFTFAIYTMEIVEQPKSAAKSSRVPPWKQKDLPQVMIVAGTTNDGRLFSALMIPNVLLCKWHYEHEAQLTGI